MYINIPKSIIIYVLQFKLKDRYNYHKLKNNLNDEIIEFIKENNLLLKDLVYLIINDLNEIPHCKNCGNVLTNLYPSKKYCSRKCVNESEDIRKRIEQTNLERYGNKCTLQSNTIKEKSRETCLRRYGVENSFQSKEIQNKCKNTCLERYGNEVAAKSDIVKIKTKNTCLERYGKNSFVETDEFKTKSLKTLQKNYNVSNPFQSEIIKNKIKETNIQRYGVEYPSQSEEIRSKITESYIKNYNVDHYNKSESAILNLKKINRIRYYSNFIENLADRNIIMLTSYETYISPSDIIKFKCNKCNFEFESQKEDYIKCPNCSSISNVELSVYKFVTNFIPEDDIIRNTRTVISDDNQKYELDIYIPSKNLAIEFNGIYWHSDIFKDKYYHQNKFLACYEKGIRLIQINEFDWNTNRSIVESIIKDALDVHEHQIDANDCTVNEIDERTYMCFLFENSLQLLEEKDKYYGMFYEDRLVCVIGIKDGIATYAYDLSYKIDNLYEVVRTYSNKLKFDTNYSNYYISDSYELLEPNKFLYEYFIIHQSGDLIISF